MISSESLLEYDFAPHPQPCCLDDDTPRAWRLQHSQGRKTRTLTPITSFNNITKPPASSYLPSDVKSCYIMDSSKSRLRWTRRSDKSEEGITVIKKSSAESSNQSGTTIAFARHNPSRTSCTLTSASGQMLQTIEHEKEPRSRYWCTTFHPNTDGSSLSPISSDNTDSEKARPKSHLYWQTLGPSQTVLELLDPTQDKRVALFVITSDIAQQIDPESGKRKFVKPDEFGQLFITSDLDGKLHKELESLLSSTFLVTDMRRTRTA